MYSQESGASITCVTSGRSLILVGDTTGRVHALGRDYSIRHFNPFQTTVETLELVKQTSLLIVVGKDQPETSQSVLKVHSRSIDRKHSYFVRRQ